METADGALGSGKIPVYNELSAAVVLKRSRMLL